MGLLRKRRAPAVAARAVERLDPVGATALGELSSARSRRLRPSRLRAVPIRRELADARGERLQIAGGNQEARAGVLYHLREAAAALAITGRPRSIASSATIPKPSPNEGTTTISARSKTGADGATRPRNDTRSSSPSRTTLARSSCSSGPVSSDLQVTSGRSPPTVASARSEHLVLHDRDQAADDREPRHLGERRRGRARLDPVVDDLEGGLVEPLAHGEVPGQTGRDRDVHVCEPRNGRSAA